MSSVAAPAPAGAQPPPTDGQELVVTVRNAHGLHARPAARLVQTAGRFDADIMVENLSNGRGPVTARSLISVTTLGVEPGHEIRVRATGAEARQAIEEIGALAAANFGDDPA